jgi:uncharacterized RDD family membrane protein YckC
MTNPYEPPETQTDLINSPDRNQNQFRDSVPTFEESNARRPAVSPVGTNLPRHMAAILDVMLTAILGVLIAQQFPEEWLVPQAICLIVFYVAYFMFFEIVFGTTPGKWLLGLKVLSFDGTRCTPKQVTIRTLFRLIETNPLLLGAIPAAARIVMTRDKQRFGDKVADTIVVFRRSIKDSV